MTQQEQPAIVGWDEPSGLNPRGTVIVLPGRGERPEVYERFGRRLAADAYRVRAVASPAEDPVLAEEQVRSLLDGPGPVVLAGSDTGALFAGALVGSGRLPEAAALVLAGLPAIDESRVRAEGRAPAPGLSSKGASPRAEARRRPARTEERGSLSREPKRAGGLRGLRREGARDERLSDEGAQAALRARGGERGDGARATERRGSTGRPQGRAEASGGTEQERTSDEGGGRGPERPQASAGNTADPWAAELEARTACPTHRGKLAGDVLRRGALSEPVPEGWIERADLKAVAVPVLGLHGAADPVSPLTAAREKYAAAPHAELVSIADGRHDAFNDITHRTAAAVIVLFLERLRNGAGLAPIAVSEPL